MAYNTRANYTMLSGLNVHPVHVSRTDEEGNVTQDRVWATVAQVADPFCVHARVDIDVLQPKFQGLHYGVQTIDEMRRRKRRRTAALKKEEAKTMREENRQQDQSAQQRAGVDWEQARIDLWRQELERRELAVRARESAVFKREEEYRRLERCPLCGRKGRRGGADERRTRENVDAQAPQAGGQAETSQRDEQRRRRVIARRTTTRGAPARAEEGRRDDPHGRSRAGQIIQRALDRETEQTNGNDGREAWNRTCTAQRMTPQRSPFQADRAGSGVEVHGPLQRRQTPYPRFVVTTGNHAARQPPPANEELPRDEDNQAIEDRGSRARAQEGPADGEQ